MQTSNPRAASLPPLSKDKTIAPQPASLAPKRPKHSISVWRQKLESSNSDVLTKLVERAGLIGREQIIDAHEIAESLKKSMDQVIVTSFLSEFQVELCSAAMSYIDRGFMTEALAVDGLVAANSKGISFQEGLKYFGFGW